MTGSYLYSADGRRLPVPVEHGIVEVDLKSDVAGVRVALVRERSHLCLVDAPVERPPELGVAQHRIAQRRPLVAVEGEVVEGLLRAGLSVEARVALQRLHLRGRNVDGQVDGAQLEVLRQRVLVLVDLEDDLVHVGRAAPAGRVGHAADELALLPLDHPEGTRAHDRRLVQVVLGSVRGLELAPDVLGDDGTPHRQDVGFGVRAGDDHRGIVGSRDRLDAVERREKRLELLLPLVVEAEGDVPSGQGTPSLHITPLRILKVHVRPSALVVQLSASPGAFSRYWSP